MPTTAERFESAAGSVGDAIRGLRAAGGDLRNVPSATASDAFLERVRELSLELERLQESIRDEGSHYGWP